MALKSKLSKLGRRPFDHGQDMLVAVAIDADRRHQDMVADMQTVDLDD